MPDTATLPKPLKRRSFTARQRNEIANRQEWLCNICKCDLWGIRFDVDHVHRLDALGKHEPSNWQALCVPCHAEKTRTDNREAKKGRRIRGLAGQAKRRKERGGSSIKGGAKLQSRGFDRTKTKGFDGKVRERT